MKSEIDLKRIVLFHCTVKARGLGQCPARSFPRLPLNSAENAFWTMSRQKFPAAASVDAAAFAEHL